MIVQYCNVRSVHVTGSRWYGLKRRLQYRDSVEDQARSTLCLYFPSVIQLSQLSGMQDVTTARINCFKLVSIRPWLPCRERGFGEHHITLRNCRRLPRRISKLSCRCLRRAGDLQLVPTAVIRTVRSGVTSPSKNTSTAVGRSVSGQRQRLHCRVFFRTSQHEHENLLRMVKLPSKLCSCLAY